MVNAQSPKGVGMFGRLMGAGGHRGMNVVSRAMHAYGHKGFTLIELLVVIAIIGLLSTLAVVALNSARAKSRDAKRIADVKQIRTALELYYADNNNYPATAGTLGGGAFTKLCSTGWSSAACGGTTYMGTVPAAPTTADGVGASVCNATGALSTSYVYATSATTGYTIDYCLGARTGDVSAGSHQANANGAQ